MTTRPNAASILAVGFTLIELLVVLLVVVLLVTTALPKWRSYQASAVQANLSANVQSMALFQEDHRIRYGVYAANLLDRQQIATVLGWRPRKADDNSYSIEFADADHYVVRAQAQAGESICLIMPQVQRCDS